VIRDIDSDITFSPDGRRIGFARGSAEQRNYSMLTASLDGSDERVLQTGPLSDMPNALAWSPDGKRLAYSLFEPDKALGGIGLFDFVSNKIQRFATFEDKLTYNLKWQPDGSGLIAVYRQKGANYLRKQIGFIPEWGVQFQPITRDANSYATLTLSGDGRTLATVQTKIHQNLYVLPATGSQPSAPNTLLPEGQYVAWFDWTRDGNPLITDGVRVWRIASDRNIQSHLLADSTAAILEMSNCGTHYLVFASAFRNSSNSVNIWRTNADGTNAVKLTNGKDDRFPICSTDEKWAYYFDNTGRQMWRVPLDGAGQPEIVPRSAVAHTLMTGLEFSLSADNKLLAYTVVTVVTAEKPKSECKIAVLDLGSMTRPRLLNADERSLCRGVNFTPNGEALSYVFRVNGVDNIWVQPFDGSAARPITNFHSEQIATFHWSPDGRTLGILRGHSESDVVLLQESKP
jgi:Tol biopolymer transport system component